FDPDDLLRIVREDADRRQSEVGKDLVADAVVAHVGREAELEIRLHRVEAALLQLVCPQLVEQPDPSSFLRHVEKYTAVLGRDALQRVLELLAAVAAQGVKNVSRQTLSVNSDEYALRALAVT